MYYILGDLSTIRRAQHQTAFSQKTYEWGGRIPTGVLLGNRSLPTFEERLSRRALCYQADPPARRAIADEEGVTRVDLTPIFDEVAVKKGTLSGS